MTATSLPKTIAALAACLAICAVPAFAAQGDLDTSFGTGGEIVDSLGHDTGIGRAVLVQPDGKIVVAGAAEQGSWLSDFAMIRYLPDGTRDSTFGQSGRVYTKLGGTNTSGTSLALQKDGKLVLAGRAEAGTDRYDFALARYDTNGAVDTTFGSSGLATLGLRGTNGIANSVAVQSDGKIVVAGEYRVNEQDRMVVARFLANGTLDTSFGDGGKVIPFIGGVWDSANSVVIQPDGKIVVAGTASDPDVQECFALVRFHPNGALDSSFGAGGKVTTLIKGDTLSGGQSVLLQGDGKIVLSGYTWQDGLAMALARYRADGTLDSGFGEAGMVVTSFTAGAPELGYGAALESNGRILVTGTSEANGTNCLTVVRYFPDGALDTSFGSGGRVTSSFGRNSAYYDSPGRAVAVQGDGKIIAVGGTDVGWGTKRLALARYLGTPQPEIVVEQPLGTSLSDGSAAVDFGSVATGSQGTTRTFTVRNSGTETLLGLVASRDGLGGSEDFWVGDSGVSLLAPGETTTFTVTFAPTAPGSRTATIHIVSNDPDENPFDLTVSGTGVGQTVPGALDTVSGIGGRMTTPIGISHDRVGGMALQSDGKLLVAGYSFNGSDYDFALVRYGDSLYLDPAFGNAGDVTTPVGSSHDYGRSVAVQPDGKIVVAGDTYNDNDSDFALVRYHPDGTLDSSFGVEGRVATFFGNGSGEVGRSVAIQNDGKIVVAGYSDNGNVTFDFAVVRYQADGALDTSFGTGGKVLTPLGSGDDQGLSLALQGDGKIVVAGYSENSDGKANFAVVRYQADGTLDSGFGSGGKVTTALGAHDDSGHSVIVQSDGKIVVAGQTSNGGTQDFALVRYLSDGTLDPTFGNGGRVITDIGINSDDIGRDVVVQTDGKIVVAGSSSASGNYDFALVRYLANGTLDTGFGHAGKMVAPIVGFDDFGLSVVLQNDGKIAVAGETIYNGTDYDFGLVRFLGATAPEIAVEQGAGNNLTDGSSTVDFGSVELGAGPASRTFTVRNVSVVMLNGLALSKDGANAADFTVSALTTARLGNGESTTFSVTFTPSAGGLRSAAIHIASEDADENPFDIALVGTGLTGPEITTASPLPSGMVGVSYSLSLTASGGTAPYTWSISAGSLPAGLVLSGTGLLEGTPTSAATANFTARVTGSDGLASMKVLSLTVVPALKPGSLDPTFGTDGKVTTAFRSGDDFAHSAVVLSDGKIVVAGYTVDQGNNNFDFALARYQADGSLDTSFGVDGKVTTDVAEGLHYGDFGRSIVLQSDGKILVAGEASYIGSYAFAVARYHTDGSLDTSFGDAGTVRSTAGFAKTILVQGDGKIVLAGQFGIDFGVERYLPNGTLDTSFGSAGKVTTDFNNDRGADYAQAAALQSDGKIVVVGYAPGTNDNDIALARYLVDGTLDPAFGNGGKVSTRVGTFHDYGWDVAVQSDGKIVVAGEVSGAFTLLRYLPDGSLDGDFGTTGKAITSIGNYGAFAKSLAVQGDGKIVMAGYVGNGQNYDFALVRYLSNGALDDSFGTGGKVVTPIGSGHDYGRSVVLQADGHIVVAGSSDTGGGNDDFALVRYIGSLEPEVSVEQPAGTRLADGSASVGFGAVEPGSTPVVRTFTVKSAGAAMLTELAVTRDGANAADFTIGSLGATSLAPGASLTFTVSFSPAALGPRAATLHIASNDADENPFDITLNGIGGSLSPLQAWRLAHFGSPNDSGDGANANDFDSDGYVNLLEYGSGSDPRVPDAAAIRPAASAADDKFLYTFSCDARCTDITYTVQATAALETVPWIDIAKSVGGRPVSPESMVPFGPLCEVTDTGTGLRRVTIAIPASSFANHSGFLRVRVSE